MSPWLADFTRPDFRPADTAVLAAMARTLAESTRIRASSTLFGGRSAATTRASRSYPELQKTAAPRCTRRVDVSVRCSRTSEASGPASGR
jgi:hypothetical protein